MMNNYQRVKHVTGKDKYRTYQVVESVWITETQEPVDKDLLNKWKGCILDDEGKVVQRSRFGCPQIGATFGNNGYYTLITIPVINLSAAIAIQSEMYAERDKQEKIKGQTETQRLAQQQVSLNATKIAKLEEELKQLRITQKLLKGLR